MFISSIPQKYTEVDELFRLDGKINNFCHEIRKERPWSKIYHVPDNKSGKFTIEFSKPMMQKELIKVNDTISRQKLEIIDRGHYLKYDEFFVFKCVRGHKLGHCNKISISGQPFNTTEEKEYEVDQEGINTYLFDKVDAKCNYLVCESKKISYPTNITSDQCNKYHLWIEYTPELLEFVGMFFTYVDMDLVGIDHKNGLFWGPKQNHYFNRSNYPNPEDLKSIDPEDLKSIDDYCVAEGPSKQPIVKPPNEKPLTTVKLTKPVNLVIHEQLFDKSDCEFFINEMETAHATQTTHTMDKNIQTIIRTFDPRFKKDLETFLVDFKLANHYRILKYHKGVGSEPHNDFPEFNPLATHRLLVYLNEDFIGGHLEFADKRGLIEPKQGLGVIFNFFDTHWALPVMEGIKYVLTGELVST